MRVLLIIASLAAATGCATAPSWTVENRQDRFTDSTACRVVPGAVSLANALQPYNTNFYPYVEARGSNDVRVGMFNGSNTLPAGRIQLRIDDNAPWTIETSETPVDSEGQFSAASITAQMGETLKNNPQLREQMEDSARATAGQMNRAMSPYTAATGEKARSIIAQMKAGTQMIYRQTGANAAGTATGTIALGPEVNAALARCGL